MQLEAIVTIIIDKWFLKSCDNILELTLQVWWTDPHGRLQ